MIEKNEKKPLYTHPKHGGRFDFQTVVERELFNRVLADANRRGISRSAQVREVVAHAYGLCDPESCESCVEPDE